MEPLSESEKQVLELATRKKIFEVVRKFAGCHFREIGRKSGLPTGTVKYHLAYLAKHELVREERDKNNVRYFPKEFTLGSQKLLSLLRKGKVREIILFILQNPGCNHNQIVSAVHVSPSTVSWHLRTLEESGVVGSRKEGRKTFYRLVINEEEIISLLTTYQQSFLDELVDRVIEMWE